jgi:tetratricopeptide (TPR) repeat protein
VLFLLIGQSFLSTLYPLSFLSPARQPSYLASTMDRLEALREFLREDPADPFTRFALASEHLKRGEVDEALAHFESLRNDHPDYVGTYYHLAGLYATIGRYADARATYRAGIDVASRLGDVHARAELQSALMAAEEANA